MTATATAAVADRGKWTYVPALDGVRAIAVVAVVLFHYWPTVFGGGFIGVDIFFVMSGYLITGILAAEFERNERLDLPAFWGRRIRRLVPAVVVLVAVCSVVAVLVGTGSARQLADSVGALTWSTNAVEAVWGGSQVWLYNPRTVLDHLWSLAIEEQFYLLWPLLAGLMLRRVRSRRWRVGLVVAPIVASATAMGLVSGVDAYFRTDTRAFELLIGAALSLTGWATARRVAPVVPLVAGLSGLGGIVAVVVAVDDGETARASSWMYPWGFLVVCLAAAAMVYAAAVGPPAFRAPLEWGPVRHLGQVSYGVYLWHIPVQRFMSSARVRVDGWALHVLRFAVLAIVVEVSYRLVEEPFRRGRLRLGAPQVATGYVLAAVALVPMLWPAAHDRHFQWDEVGEPPSAAPGRTRILVVGDLLGAVAADSLAKDDDLAVWALTDPGCPMQDVGADQLLDGSRPMELDASCGHWRRRWPRAAAKFHPGVVVIGGGYWDTLAHRRPTTVAEDGEVYRRLIGEQVEVARATGDPQVVLVRVDDWSKLVDAKQRPLVDRLAALDAYNAAIDEVAAGAPDVEVVDVSGAGGWADVRALRGDDLPA